MLTRWFTAMGLLCTSVSLADEPVVHSFERTQLTATYFSEGANAGDLNADGIQDIVYGPYWFEGPRYQTKHEIYPPVPQDTNRYADNFFSWVYDFDSDGWNDVLVAGFPGTPAYVYENPKREGGHWKKHPVFDWVSNESPQWVDLVGDERPELVCTRDGFFGYVTVNWEDPFGDWTFHRVSRQVTAKRFGHGLGVGDINGDGRQDILHPKGWYEQPASNADSSPWRDHEVSLCGGYGGAEMYAYDVDGDGDNDVITSDSAHDFGLSWYEQVRDGDAIEFRRHLIMGSHPSENKYGVVFSEPHSVALVDMDGDGLKDIVTGKTYWSHHRKSPMWDAGAVVYWFKLVRRAEGIDWIPFLADADSGIGRQVSIADVNSDGLPDIVVGGMKGAHVLTHHAAAVSVEDWQAAQPRVYAGPKLPSVDNAKAKRGPKSEFVGDATRVVGAIEGEALTAKTTAGSAKPQDMSRFQGDRWSGQSQLWWTGGRPGDSLTLELPNATGTIDLEVVLTCARDYGIVQLSIDDQPLGEPIDLYAADVITTGILSFPKLQLSGDQHTLGLQLLGANRSAKKAYMVAIDYVRLKTDAGEFLTVEATTEGSRDE